MRIRHLLFAKRIYCGITYIDDIAGVRSRGTGKCETDQQNEQ